MCSTHYSRWKRHGDPLVMVRRRFPTTGDDVIDFWSLVDKTAGTDGCWPWRGTITVHGYGAWHKFPAHRYAYILEHGPVDNGLVIDHRCHIPGICPGGPSCRHRRCVNPAHLAAVQTVVNVSPQRSSNGRPADDRCSVEGCDAPYIALGLCSGHYQRLRKHGTTFPDRPLRHWRSRHYPDSQAARCAVDGCGRPPHARVMCAAHYRRWVKHGDPLPHQPIRRSSR